MSEQGYQFFRPILFRLDPETAHALTLYALRSTQFFPPLLWLLERACASPPKPVDAFGLPFKNPVGLAAGYDKDGVAVRGLSALGFGHIEVGTVTPRPQPGNPKPRVFRLVEDEAVINRMGFPGKGMDRVAISLRASAGRAGRAGFEAVPRPSERGILLLNEKVRKNGGLLRSYAPRTDALIGVNLGKNKDTPLEEAASDYITLIRTFTPLADYLAINVSSPNTVGLRRLQGREMLEGLLGAIAAERLKSRVLKPILVKLAPDLSDEELDDAVGVILDCGMDGIVATNTTLEREGLRSKHRTESGGLSGSPLKVRSETLLGKIVRLVDGRVPIVSVGGIMDPKDAKRRLDMGAALVQVYTGLIYRGPGLVREIVDAL
jgi:dihydroorotate dehydrogenase